MSAPTREEMHVALRAIKALRAEVIGLSLLSNPEWRRQMEESHTFFLSGGKGRTLREVGRE